MCILLVTVGLFFSNRVINIWNALADSIVKSPSVNSFKSKINSLHFCGFCADCAVRLYFFILFLSFFLFFWGGGGAC